MLAGRLVKEVSDHRGQLGVFIDFEVFENFRHEFAVVLGGCQSVANNLYWTNLLYNKRVVSDVPAGAACV